MRFNDQISFIMQHLKRSKLRIFMTILATTIGCAFLIVLASVGFGFQKTLEDEILSSDTVTQIMLWGDESFTDEDVKKIEQKEHVKVVLEKTMFEGYVESKLNDREGSMEAVIYDMNRYEKLESNVKEGRLPEKANEIIVGKHFGQALLNDVDRLTIEQKMRDAEKNGTYYDGSEEGYKGELIGTKVKLRIMNYNDEPIQDWQEFTIVGIKPDPAYDWMQDSSIIFHQDMKSTKGLETYNEHKIYVDTAENVMPLLKELRDEGYQVYSQVEQLDEMGSFFLVAKIVLIFVGTIAVVIASIGIFNTMTMAVTERTREIGILKAMGATPSLIQRLFLMESLFIGIIGTALALIISYAVSFAGNLIAPMVMQSVLNEGEPLDFQFTFSLITPSLVLTATLISLAVAVLSGWRPARKATKIEVVEALQQV